MASRPATVPQLDTNETNRVIPAAGKITDGYSLNDILPASSANYLWGWSGDWLEWLDERTEDGTTPGTDLTFRGLDALTLTGDGGILTLVGGDGGGTSGDGGNILLLPGDVTSGTKGFVGVNTAAPAVELDVVGDGVNAIRGTGGANSDGVVGVGTGTGDGVFGTGGTNSDGVVGVGAGTGDGVFGTGGATNGKGVIGIGGATNGTGVRGIGTGSGAASRPR